jgi:GDP-L-fucose synthase
MLSMRRVLILGKGLVGGSLNRQFLLAGGYEVINLGKQELDLTDISQVSLTLRRLNPEVLILASGVVGGIEKNISEPFHLGAINSRIILNTIHTASTLRIPLLINLVPACVYPISIFRRMKPEDLWSGPMEPTSLPYSTAKLLGVTLVKAARDEFGLNWTSLVATNLYGDDSTLHSHSAHVIPALLTKFANAKNSGFKEVQLLGDGTPIREFLHVDDFSLAVKFVLDRNLYTESILNVAGQDSWTIKELADLVQDTVGYKGQLRFANDGKNGAPMKLLDGTKLHNLGWTPKISLSEGVAKVFSKFPANDL